MSTKEENRLSVSGRENVFNRLSMSGRKSFKVS